MADEYEKMRPGYPTALYEDIFRAVPLGASSRALPEKVRKEFFAKVEEPINTFGGQITLCDIIDLELVRKP